MAGKSCACRRQSYLAFNLVHVRLSLSIGHLGRSRAQLPLQTWISAWGPAPIEANSSVSELPREGRRGGADCGGGGRGSLAKCLQEP